MKLRSIQFAIPIVAFFSVLISPVALSDGAALEEGKKITFDRKLGNCLACHVIPEGTMGGTIGPPLIAMSARYPDKAVLRAQIFDATANNPKSIMPPFGKHGVLSDKQIDLITDFIHSL